MADEADMADAIVAEHIARGLTAIDRTIPAGVAGQCDGCGEVMPRLVGGLCGFCRDGRRPPLSWFDEDRTRPVPEAAPHPDLQPASAPSPEETAMVSYTSGSKPITVPTPIDIYQHIQALADSLELPMGRAALVLIERGMAAPADAHSHADGSRECRPVEAPAPLPLESIALEALLAEIARRFEHAADDEALGEAVARAEAAESQLAAIKQLLGGAA